MTLMMMKKWNHAPPLYMSIDDIQQEKNNNVIG